MHAFIDLFHVGEPATLLTLALIYTAAAVFSGLSGFGFSAIGCLSLTVLLPQLGVPVLMGLSLATQALSFGSLLPELRRHFGPWNRRDGVMPYLIGGTLGMPAGLAILTAFGARTLTVALGLLLVGYSIWSLLKPAALRFHDQAPSLRRSLLVGAAGGVIGGFSALPGAALVIWNGLTGVGKEAGRALTQPFILWMQLVGLALLLATRPQLFDAASWTLFGLALPAALLGNVVGVAIYRKTCDIGYRRVTFVALGTSGLGLVVKVMLP